MRRAATEKPRTLRTWDKHLRFYHASERLSGRIECRCDVQANRFRKGQRATGCSKRRCICKIEKLCDRPTIKDRMALERERDDYRALDG